MVSPPRWYSIERALREPGVIVCNGDVQTIPPPSNSLSGAPSALKVAVAAAARDPELEFFDLVRPEDLSAVFQPIVSLDNGKLFAYEALVRCKIPNFSPPVLFERAAAARATGRLGRMIREIAVPLCSGTPLFVNLHPSELEEGWLVRLDDPVFSHDDDIYLEVTESAPMTHLALCVSVLREVCGRAGVHLVIDDLGAGYSNLNLIADLEPRVVKLDRKLVQDLHKKPRQQKVVAMVTKLCVELGATVVAEGIETRDEFRAVCDSGAHYGQGYLLARPGFPLPAIMWPPEHRTEPPPTMPERKAAI
jgi:EAL domain-containing protein (putative c-di-GMP-specific phosphodiesterase class I)